MTALRKPPLSIVGAEPETDDVQRTLEAILFASAEPVDEKLLASRLPEGTDLKAELQKLADHYAARGVNLVRVAGKWALRTASDLGHRIARDTPPPKKLSRAAIETLAIVAYHQPVTRAEIEEIRGVTINKGTLDVLIETGLRITHAHYRLVVVCALFADGPVWIADGQPSAAHWLAPRLDGTAVRTSRPLRSRLGRMSAPT